MAFISLATHFISQNSFYLLRDIKKKKNEIVSVIMLAQKATSKR
jgi:hypothetical protein